MIMISIQNAKPQKYPSVLTSYNGLEKLADVIEEWDSSADISAD